MSVSSAAAVLFLLGLLAPTFTVMVDGKIMSKRLQSTCETIPAEIHITKDEFDENSVLQRTCEENIAVNKCEGACASSIQPSALNSLGFQKDCFCCRESSYRRRQITLSNCFDADGIRLTGGDKASMVVSVNEPVDCKCHECGKRP